MNIKIVKNIGKSELKNHIPLRFRNLISGLVIKSQLVDILIFRQKKLVFVRDIEKLNVKYSSNNALIVFGNNFSSEARNFLNINNIVFISLSDFYWTEDSYLKPITGSRKLKKS